MKMKYLHVVLLLALAAFVCACQSATTGATHAAAPTAAATATEFIATGGSSANFSATGSKTPSVRSTATAPTGHATPTVLHTPTPTYTLTRLPTATAAPTRQPTIAPTIARPAPTPAPKGVNGNPWGYDFTPGSYITTPPGAFCSYFACITSFWNGHGYVVECQDTTYGKSGGISGSCSHHGGNLRALYAH